MLAFQMAGIRHSQESLALRMWNWGNWALLGAFTLMVSRLVFPLWVSVIGTNIFLLVGMSFYSQAIYQFLVGTVPRLFWILLGISIACVFAFYPLEFARRTSLYALLNTIVMLPALWHLIQHGWNRERNLRVVAIAFVLTVIGLIWRAFDSWSDPIVMTDIAQPGKGPGITFLLAFVTMLGAGFGFILAALERSAQQLEDLATHDGLTDCLNRNAAIALLGNLLQRGQRTGEANSLVMLDLDHFKLINDRHGHHAGDEVLRQFANIARKQLRASDVLARMGGEEFALILPGTDAVGAVHVAESVRAAVQAMVVVDLKGGSIKVTVSAGVACSAANSAPTTPDLLYHRADTALYAAKEAGRNRIELAADL